MLVFSKNKIFFIALTLLSSYSLTQCAFSRFQSVRPAISAVTGWRSLSGYSRTDNQQESKMWELRQRQIDELGNVPKDLQKALHLISRNAPYIDPALNILIKYNLDKHLMCFGMDTPKEMKIASSIKTCLSHDAQEKIRKIVSDMHICTELKLKRTPFFLRHLIKYSGGGPTPLQMYCRETFLFKKNVIECGDFFIDCLGQDSEKAPQLQEIQSLSAECASHDHEKTNLLTELDKIKHFNVGAGLLVHELGHIQGDHAAICNEMKKNPAKAHECLQVGRFLERLADAAVVVRGNQGYLAGLISYLKLLSRDEEFVRKERSRLNAFDFISGLQFEQESPFFVLRKTPEQKAKLEQYGKDKFVLIVHPPIQERIDFLQSELVRMQGK